MKAADLLIEIGCEEIPARMIRRAAADFGARLLALLDQHGLRHGDSRAWGGSRRLTVAVAAVQERQPDHRERVLGPPASVAYAADGAMTKAALGFAKKQQLPPERLETIETSKGSYVGFEREVSGKALGELLAEFLPPAVAQISFPKTMRWGAGAHRWVRPVHWLLALHGDQVLPIELFGVRAMASSMGHRFLSSGVVEIPRQHEYMSLLEGAHVIVDPEKRGSLVKKMLVQAAQEIDAELVDDPHLLDEVSSLVEWPGVVRGEFSTAFLKLPREILITTLRYHQKCFALQSVEGRLLPAFLAIANTDKDRSGHIKRGNEWVVAGRLEDARYFWTEDRKIPLSERTVKLEGMVVHSAIGTYAQKAERLQRLAGRTANLLGLSTEQSECCAQAALLAKNDLVTGTVGEFPELQGKVGGLLVSAEGGSAELAAGIYQHYLPLGPADAIPTSPVGLVVSAADKLDQLAEFFRIGELPTGSHDPFGLRRAANGLFRIIVESDWSFSLSSLVELSDGGTGLGEFLQERLQAYLKDAGYTTNEIRAVFRPTLAAGEPLNWALPDIQARLDALRPLREREDFARLVELTKRVDNILTKNAATITEILDSQDPESYAEDKSAALELAARVDSLAPRMATESEHERYSVIVELLAQLIDPVDTFFDQVLVLDQERPDATGWRLRLLFNLRTILTTYFDIRELAGEADRRKV